jgi:hypothetical protein
VQLEIVRVSMLIVPLLAGIPIGDGPTGKDRKRFSSAKADSPRKCRSCCSICLCGPTSFVLLIKRGILTWRIRAWNCNQSIGWRLDRSRREFRYHQATEGSCLQRSPERSRCAFHAHFSKDNHRLIMNGALCRKYLQQIKMYWRKIEKAMT